MLKSVTPPVAIPQNGRVTTERTSVPLDVSQQLQQVQERVKSLRQQSSANFSRLDRRLRGVSSPYGAVSEEIAAVDKEIRGSFTDLSKQIEEYKQKQLLPLEKKIETYIDESSSKLQKLADDDAEMLKDLEGKVLRFCRDIDHLTKGYNELRERMSDSRQQLDRAREESQELEASIQQLEREVQEVKKRLANRFISTIAVLGACVFATWAIHTILSAASVGSAGITGVAAGDAATFYLGSVEVKIGLSASTGAAVAALSSDKSSDKEEEKGEKKDAITVMERNLRLEEMQRANLTQRLIEIPSKVVEVGVKEVCNSHPNVKDLCNKTEKFIGEGVQWAIDQVPEKVKGTARELLIVRERSINDEAQLNKERYGIPEEQTKLYHDNLANIAGNGFSFLPIGAGARSIVKKIPSKWDYSKNFAKDVKNFSNHREIRTVLKKDLELVQYHGSGELGVERSLKYWVRTKQANGFATVEQVADKLALLSEWGKRTHVTVAKIPAGEAVHFLMGPAQFQGPLATGGAVQIRMKAFNPDWIVKTAPIEGEPLSSFKKWILKNG